MQHRGAILWRLDDKAGKLKHFTSGFTSKFFLLTLSWVMKSILLNLYSCQCFSSRKWEVCKKNGLQSMLFLVYLKKLFSLALNLKFLHKNDIF